MRGRRLMTHDLCQIATDLRAAGYTIERIRQLLRDCYGIDISRRTLCRYLSKKNAKTVPSVCHQCAISVPTKL
jgi:intein-encoded DNA endonuclease-like protein